MFSKENEETVMNADQWRHEARGIINDIQEHVRSIEICKSPDLQSTDKGIYLNLTTLEGFEFCVKLSNEGFLITDNKYESVNVNFDKNETYETIYALLDSVSPKYRNSFGNSLIHKLQKIKDNET